MKRKSPILIKRFIAYFLNQLNHLISNSGFCPSIYSQLSIPNLKELGVRAPIFPISLRFTVQCQSHSAPSPPHITTTPQLQTLPYHKMKIPDPQPTISRSQLLSLYTPPTCPKTKSNLPSPSVPHPFMLYPPSPLHVSSTLGSPPHNYRDKAQTSPSNLTLQHQYIIPDLQLRIAAFLQRSLTPSPQMHQ